MRDLHVLKTSHFYRPIHGERERQAGLQAHTYVDVEALPSDFLITLITHEDEFFFQHRGVYGPSLWRALKTSVKTRKLIGGSSITQQLMKNLFLSPERSFLRKWKEMKLALAFEKIFSKEQILSLYVSNIEWGRGVYGIKEAAQHYFKKYPNQLGRNECLFLGLITPEPRYFDHAFFDLKSFSKEFRAKYVRAAMILDLLERDGEKRLGLRTIRSRIFHLEFQDRFLALAPADQAALLQKGNQRFLQFFNQYVAE